MANDLLSGPAATVRLNAEHPWPGLSTYEEASREFFHGRETEAAELLRLIQLNPLTALYGKSGLGKSSLLQAGLFPLLRSHRDPCYLPVYCRLDFSAKAALGPAEQIAQRLEEEIDRGGAEGPVRNSGEGLWEYLHRRKIEIWSRDNFLITPVLVLDQFEELFSVSGDAERIAQVFDDLAALIENRIPAELAVAAATERMSRLDLNSHHYRVVLSFREDYLPDVKAWENKIPSLLRNYLRLEPLTRRRAVEAVEQAGRAVLKKAVAPVIVDFVGKLDASAEPAQNDRACIEPTLLSLFCYQLDLRRGDKPIDKALITKSGRDILEHFYRDTLDDDDVKGPPDVAMFIEDYLVQGDRFRGLFPKAEALKENILTKRQLDALTTRHRLLRVVEYAGALRIELIHDCLVPVVCKARNERKSRERQAELERKNRERHAELERKARDAEARVREKQRYISWLTISLVLMGLLLAFALWEWREETRAEQRATAHTAIGASYLARRERKDPDVSALFALQALSLAQRVGDPELAARAEDQLRRRLGSRLLWSFPHPAEVNAVAFSPDGRLLVSASGKGFHLWNLETGKEESTAMALEHRGKIKKIVFTADGSLAAGDGQGDLRLWDLRTGKEKTPPHPMRHEPGISALAAGPQNLLASATLRGGDILLWNTVTGNRLGPPFGQDGESKRWFFDLAISADGTRLASADVNSGRTTVWDLGSRAGDAAPIASFTLESWRLARDPAADPRGMLVNSVAFSRDGRLLATGDRFNSANLWDGETGEHRGALVGHTASVRDVAFNRDASRLATASEDKTAAVWDTASRKMLFTLDGHKNIVLDLDYSPDGGRLATAGGKDRTAKVWNAETHAGAVHGVAFSPDGKFLATAGDDRIIRVWDVQSRGLVARLIGHQGLVHRIVFSPDGKHLASASHDETARIWDWSAEQEILEIPFSDKVNDVAYSPDGKWLATAGADYNAVLWEAATGQRMFAGPHKHMVWAVAFSPPNGKYLASASNDGLVKLWDVPSGTLVACAKGPKKEGRWPYGLRQVLDVNFSPDGSRLLLATGQGSVYLVDEWRSQLQGLPIGKGSSGVDDLCEGGVMLPTRMLRLKDRAITTAKFTPDSKSLITTGSRYQVTIQDAETGKEQKNVGVHMRGKVNEAALSRDGFWIATAGDDGSFHVSPLETDDLERAVCDRLSRKSLMKEECREYLGSGECQPPVCNGELR